MTQMKIYILSETVYSSTHWYENTFAGIRDRVLQKGFSLASVYVDEGQIPPKEAISNCSSMPILLLGTSVSWIKDMIGIMQDYGNKVILLGCDIPRGCQKVSSINLSHYDAIFDVIRYLVQCGRQHIALTGINPASIADMLKQEGYFSALESYNLFASNDMVFYNNGSLADNECAFIKEVQKFDAVICSNDVVAVSLLRQLERTNISVPKDLFVIGFGNTLLGQVTIPSLTTVELNYYEVGWHAVDTLIYLAQNPSVLSISATVQCRIIARSTTAFQNVLLKLPGYEAHSEISATENLFYKDPKVIELLNLEEWYHSMDLIDCGIVLGIYEDVPYESLAEKLNVSYGTIKYRLKKMLKKIGVKTKQDLLNIIDTNNSISAISNLYNKKKKG
jgi:DNA-binding LacI/PurR family transcriptional regulator